MFYLFDFIFSGEGQRLDGWSLHNPDRPEVTKFQRTQSARGRAERLAAIELRLTQASRGDPDGQDRHETPTASTSSEAIRKFTSQTASHTTENRPSSSTTSPDRLPSKGDPPNKAAHLRFGSQPGAHLSEPQPEVITLD